MANLNLHPAPGLGDLTSGFYVVPQNPIQMATDGISRVPSLGEFMAGSFVVPANPFFAFSTGQVQPIGQGAAGMPMNPKRIKKAPPVSMSGMAGLGCGGSGGSGSSSSSCGCGCDTPSGMGDLTSDFAAIEADFSAGNYTNILSTDTIYGYPTWYYVAGLALVGFLFLNTPSEGRTRLQRGRKRLASAIA